MFISKKLEPLDDCIETSVLYLIKKKKGGMANGEGPMEIGPFKASNPLLEPATFHSQVQHSSD